MTNIGEQGYLDMLRHIMDNGALKEDRTGTGTKSIFGHQLRFDMAQGFPLLTTKKVFFRGIAVELLWFLQGQTNIKSLVDQNVSIWSAWPHKYYNKRTGLNVDLKAFEDHIRADADFAESWGELGPVYGAQWRKWKKIEIDRDEDRNGNWITYTKEKSIDQIAKSIQLLKSDPNSRRNIVMAWNPADIDEMVISGLPPCHYGFQLATRPLSKAECICREDWFLNAPIDKGGYIDLSPPMPYKLDMMVNIRSWDTFLGGPFNIASYALLLHMYAQVVKMTPGDLVITSGDTHIYSNHFIQIEEQLKREPKSLPILVMDKNITDIDKFSIDSFKIEGYDPYPPIKGAVAV